MRGIPEGSGDDWQYQQKGTGQRRTLNEWEQTSMPLQVTKQFREEFRQFSKHLLEEKRILDDTTLEQEIELIDKLLNIESEEK